MHDLQGASGNIKDAIRTFPSRLKAMRAEQGMTQEQFIPKVNEAARHLFGAGARLYSQSTYSRLESGRQGPTLEDVAVLAACDAAHRGVLWLAYADTITAHAVSLEPRKMNPAPTKRAKTIRNRDAGIEEKPTRRTKGAAKGGRGGAR